MPTHGIVDDDDDDCDDVTIYSCGQNVRAVTCNAYMIHDLSVANYITDAQWRRQESVVGGQRSGGLGT